MRTMRHPMGGGQKTRSVQLNPNGITEKIRTVSWAVKTASSRRKTNLKPVKYTLLLEVPVLAALRTVTAGRRVKWFRIWQLMLERKGELRSRLLGAFVPLPYIYIGQHWHPDPRSRWDTVMSSRSRLFRSWPGADGRTGARHQHGTLRGKKNGKVASLELF